MDIFPLNGEYGLKTTDKPVDWDSCPICYGNEEDSCFIHQIGHYSTLYNIKEKSEICHHYFHTKCLYDWLNISKKVICPICKQGPTDVVLQKLNLLYHIDKIQHIQKFYKSGILKKDCYKIGSLYHGVCFKFDTEGRVTESTNYDMGSRHGKYQYFTYYKNRRILRMSYSYHNGLLYGTQKIFNKKGKLISSYSYDINGKKHGNFVQYYDIDESGQKYARFTGYYEHGLRHGVFVERYINGIIKESTTYYNGKKHGLNVSKFPSGQKNIVRSYQNDNLHGIVMIWNIYGSLIYRCKYNNGMKECKELICNDDGILKCISTYKNNILHGEYFSFYEGKKDIQEISTYNYGDKHGKSMIL